MSAGDVTKLPKWAQERLARLERDKRHLQDCLTEAHQAAGFREEERFRITPLDPQANIRLQVDHPHPTRRSNGGQADIDVRSVGEHVIISSPDGRLSITPVVTNSVQVSVIR